MTSNLTAKAAWAAKQTDSGKHWNRLNPVLAADCSASQNISIFYTDPNSLLGSFFIPFSTWF
jgi:hypothetical protein